MSYCKIGKFKPGDILVHNKSSLGLKLQVLGIKRRKHENLSLYKVKLLDSFSNGLTYKRSYRINIIDEKYELSLKSLFKAL